jgi:thiol:disulfide interchange protein DsbD
MSKRSVITAWLRIVAAWLLLAGVQAVHAADDFLEPERAFKFAVRVLDERTAEVGFTIAPGYYLYREQFKFSAVGAMLGVPAIPPGKVKFDQTFQKDVETYRDRVRIAIPVQQANGAFRLLVTSQGCADAGLCYPPMQSAAEVRLAAFGGEAGVRIVAADDARLSPPLGASTSALGATVNVASPSDTLHIDAALRNGRFWPVVGVFFVAGILLSLTPCVLPMLPILSSIIVGQGKEVSRGRGFALASSYSLGMAMVYTSLGIAAGLAGEGLAAALQNPIVLGAFAAGLIALAMSMFGVYELQLPSGVNGHLTRASQSLPAGRVASVFAMGGVSALIVSPCVAAPLAGALVYLSQTRDVWLGGTALFSLAAGMSVPLLLVGASAGALLPKAGLWMDEVKRFFGLLLLAVALWTVQTVLPAELVLALWGALAIGVAVLLVSPGRGHHATPSRRLWRVTGSAVFGLLGLLQFVGAASGGTDPLQPLAHLTSGMAGHTETRGALRFTPVRSVAELDTALQGAGRPVMLDFYADWCVSCKEMERFTFSDTDVQQRLSGALLLKADVTSNNASDRELLKRFALFGPPGTIFFDAQGREVPGTRVIGFQNSDRFLRTLAAAGL